MRINMTALAKKLDLTKAEIALITCRLLGYDWKEADHPRDNDGKFAKGGWGEEGKSSSKQKSSREAAGRYIRTRYIPSDSYGRPFRHRQLILPKAEYAKIMNEINTNYSLYEGSTECVHISYDDQGDPKVYHFENHEYAEYNIYGVKEPTDEE